MLKDVRRCPCASRILQTSSFSIKQYDLNNAIDVYLEDVAVCMAAISQEYDVSLYDQNCGLTLLQQNVLPGELSVGKVNPHQ